MVLQPQYPASGPICPNDTAEPSIVDIPKTVFGSAIEAWSPVEAVKVSTPPGVTQPPNTVDGWSNRRPLVASKRLPRSVMIASPVLGVLGLAGAAYLGWDWFSFRAKNGMRF